MKILTKQFILIYDGETNAIILQLSDNVTTYCPNNYQSTEFHTEQELQDYISENNLVE